MKFRIVSKWVRRAQEVRYFPQFRRFGLWWSVTWMGCCGSHEESATRRDTAVDSIRRVIAFQQSAESRRRKVEPIEYDPQRPMFQ